MKTHWFWCLCPNVHPEDGDNFTVEESKVTCEICLSEIEDNPPLDIPRELE